MIKNFTIDTRELDYLFGDNGTEIELDLGSIHDGFWGPNISMVSAIVGKNGTGKSSILRYIKTRRIKTFPYNYLDNIIYYSPHLDYIDNYDSDVDPNDISLDTILRRDLEDIIYDEKEPNENGSQLNPKQDLQYLNTARQIDFLSSKIRQEHPIFSEIFEGLKFGTGKIILRGSNRKVITEDSFHNTPNQFRPIILMILQKCEEESRQWTQVRKMTGKRMDNQYAINAYLFKRNLIISFLSVVVNLMERNNSYLREGVVEIDSKSNNAFEVFKKFVTSAKVHFEGESQKDAKPVFNFQVVELFEFIYYLVDDIYDEEFIDKKSFITLYENLEKIKRLQKEVIDNLALNYYRQRTKVNSFLGIQSTSRNLSSGENALLNFYSVLYEWLQNLDDENLHDEYVLLLDEADLGYHPEWKKRYVNSIVKSLPLFFKFDHRQCRIQIIFTTHDPLTLSDIPSQNVVFLDKNALGHTLISQGKKETFGANIHDLLADSFFISDGLMGDFAKEKINETLTWLRYKILVNEIESLEVSDRPMIDQKTIELQEIITNNSWVYDSIKEQHKLIIDLLDEPLLKFKLREMYNKIFPEEIDKNQARQKIIDLALRSGLNIEIKEE